MDSFLTGASEARLHNGKQRNNAKQEIKVDFKFLFLVAVSASLNSRFNQA
jgi:hypothetical protein